MAAPLPYHAHATTPCQRAMTTRDCPLGHHWRAQTPDPSERPLSERMDEVPALLDRAADLYADAAKLREMADNDERAARSIGFGSDRAIRMRDEAQGMTKQAEEVDALVLSIQQAAFATFGPEVEPKYVTWLVERYGDEAVWTFGYGDEPDFFTTIAEDDLWAFGGPDASEDVVESWAPFRIDANTVPADVIDRLTKPVDPLIDATIAKEV